MRKHPIAANALPFLLSFLIACFPACTTRDSGDQAKPPAEPPRTVSVGSAAPFFTLHDLSGKEVRLEEFKGRVIMLEFFTSWCLPCQMVAHDVEALYKRLKAKGLIVIGISLKDGFNKDKLREYIATYGITYPVVIDDDRISKQYGVITMPTTVIIDREGVIRVRHLGIVRDHAAMLSREIEPLIK